MCGSVDGLCLCVCVVMGLDRLIGVSWVCVCGALCVKPVLEVEGEREEKEEKKRNSKKRENKIEYLNKIGKKKEFWNVGCIVK